MSYLKRQTVPKNWPIPRKGTAYVVRPSFGIDAGLPILIILRDLLKIAQNRKEVKKALISGKILLNGKKVKDEKHTAVLFDVISIIPSKKYFKIDLTEKGKFKVKEITEAESKKKIAKVIDKKILKGKKIQLNLGDGRNFISNLKCSTNDSVVIDFIGKKIEKCLPFEEKAKIIVFSGKHSGERGNIIKIEQNSKLIEVEIEGKKVNILNKQLMVVE